MSDDSRHFTRTRAFWVFSLSSLAITSMFFAWELRLIPLPYELPRAPASSFELAYTALLTLLLSFAAGLFGWQRRFGACPVGIKRTVGVAGTLGCLALLCPVCLALPGLLLGIGTLIAILGQFLPLIRLLAILFAMVAIWMLWPKRSTSPR